MRQFSIQDFFPFWAENIAMITGAKPLLFKDSRSYLGLVPLFFFLYGFFRTFKDIFRISYHHVGALLCGIFIVLKLFPFWPALNKVVGTLPVLKESYFFVYFLSIFLWFFAFFVAQGVQDFLYVKQPFGEKRKTGPLLVVILCGVTVATLLWVSTPIAFKMTLPQLVINTEGYVHLKVLAAFLVSLLVVISYVVWTRLSTFKTFVGVLLISLAVFETLAVLPREFARIPRGNTRHSTELSKEIEKKGVSLLDTRLNDPYGTYVSGGIATIDNGAPAILPYRVAAFRRSLFNVPWGGYLPIRTKKYDYSWDLSSTSLVPKGEYLGGATQPLWNQFQKIEEGHITVDDLKVDRENVSEEQKVTENQSIFIRGWAVDPSDNFPKPARVFVVFQSEENEVSVPTKKMLRLDVANHFQEKNVEHSGWEVHTGSGLLSPGTYKVFVRAVRSSGDSYFEKYSGKKITVSLPGGEQEGSNARLKQPYSHLKYIASTGQKFIYYQENKLSRAYLATRCFAVDQVSDSIRHLKDKHNFIIGDVYVEELDEAEKVVCQSVDEDLPTRVPVREDLGKKVQLSEAKGPGLLVLSDTYYPGWHAFDEISGKELPVRPGNINMRTVVLPEAREYRIVFQYTPQWLNYARILFLAASLIAAVLFCFAFLGTVKRVKP